ncbi:MAG: hypothetical protein JXA46_02990 [Dehalococcoidales bacterium]|nr:hypothetical protein [Dehalococcoidales bacterium]
MKKRTIFASALLALLILVVAPLAAMAQDQSESSSSDTREINGGLALVAPRIVLPGDEMSMTVFLRKDQTTVEGVSIWALTADEHSLKRALRFALAKKRTIPNMEDFQTFLDEKGTLLGQTDSDGKLYCTFDETDNYVLVAVKQGYIPAFSRLWVRQVLAIDAPESAQAGEEVVCTVTIRGNQEPLSEAGVWAVEVDNPPGIKSILIELRQTYKNDFRESDWEEVLNEKALYLGETDENGEVACSFDKAGQYLLVTVEQGFVPGFRGIDIIEDEAEE